MLLEIVIVLGLFGLVITASELLVRVWNNAFLLRKISHMLCGIISAVLPYTLGLYSGLLVLLALAALAILSRYFKIYKSMQDVDSKNFGMIYFPLGLLAPYLLFSDSYPAVFAGTALLLGFADSSAALIGKYFGKKKIAGMPKTYAGSSMFLIVSFSILATIFLHIPVSDSMTFVTTVGYVCLILLGSALLTGIELVSHHGLDNLFLPPVTSVIIGILLMI